MQVALALVRRLNILPFWSGRQIHVQMRVMYLNDRGGVEGEGASLWDLQEEKENEQEEK